VTVALIAKAALHVPLTVADATAQLMPAGLDDTEPFPVPFAVTLSVGSTGAVKVAVAVALLLRVQLQAVEVPLQAPDHPANVCPAAAVAVRATPDPESICTRQLPVVELPDTVQLIPPAPDVTVPFPLPEPAVICTLYVGVTWFSVGASLPAQLPRRTLAAHTNAEVASRETSLFCASQKRA
jgi:hypothetical protein